MGKTNDLNLFLLFNRQKFPNPGFFFSLSSFRKFFPILLHREIETQIEILVSSIVFYHDFFTRLNFFVNEQKCNAIRKQIKFRLLFLLNDNKIVSRVYNVFSLSVISMFLFSWQICHERNVHTTYPKVSENKIYDVTSRFIETVCTAISFLSGARFLFDCFVPNEIRNRRIRKQACITFSIQQITRDIVTTWRIESDEPW